MYVMYLHECTMYMNVEDMHVHTYIHSYNICMYVCMYVMYVPRRYVCMYVCMYVKLHMYVCTVHVMSCEIKILNVFKILKFLKN